MLMAAYILNTCLPACLVYSEAQVNLNMANLEMAYTSPTFM
jgi:hypothetical protein